MTYPPHFAVTPDGLTHDVYKLEDSGLESRCGLPLGDELPSYGIDLPDGLTRCPECVALRQADAEAFAAIADTFETPDMRHARMRKEAAAAKRRAKRNPA